VIDVSVNLRDLEVGFFRRLRVFASDLRPAFRQMREPVMIDQRVHRSRKEGPTGRWPDLRPSTKARYAQMRRAGRKPPRSLLGRLPGSNVVTIERLRMVVMSRVPWSGVHQRGGANGPRGTVQERRFLWLSKAALAIATRRLLKVAKKTWR
jgi:hypothetical protein